MVASNSLGGYYHGVVELTLRTKKGFAHRKNLSANPQKSLPYERGGLEGWSNTLSPHEKRQSNRSAFSCLNLPDYRTFIEDYLKIVEFIEWLKENYPEKATFLTKKS